MRKLVLTAIVLMITVTVVFAGVYIWNDINPKKNITVTVQTITDSVNTVAFIVKNEAVVDLSGGEFVRYYCEEGDRVASNSRIAMVFDNTSDGKLLSDIEALDEKIALYDNEYANLSMRDAGKIEEFIDSYTNDYFEAVKTGNISDAYVAKENIVNLMNIKHSGTNSGETEVRKLKKEKEVLEAKLSSGRSAVNSPMGGIFTGRADGYEGMVDFEKAKSITVSEFDSLMSKEISAPQKKCKIVDNYTWMIMCDVPEELKTEIGDKVEFSAEQGEYIEGTVIFISEVEDGRKVVSISSAEDFSDVGNERMINVTVVFNKYSGYMVPSKAVHLYKEEEGVFVKNGNKLEFKKIERIDGYENGEYVVINPSGNTELKTHDVVVVEGDLSEFYN